MAKTAVLIPKVRHIKAKGIGLCGMPLGKGGNTTRGFETLPGPSQDVWDRGKMWFSHLQTMQERITDV